MTNSYQHITTIYGDALNTGGQDIYSSFFGNDLSGACWNISDVSRFSVRYPFTLSMFTTGFSAGTGANVYCEVFKNGVATTAKVVLTGSVAAVVTDSVDTVSFLASDEVSLHVHVTSGSISNLIFTALLTYPPSSPTGLVGVQSYNLLNISLSWTASTDPNVLSYNIYRDNIQTGSSITTSYNDTIGNSSVQHTYTVTAVNPLTGETAPSNSWTTTLPPPQISSSDFNTLWSSLGPFLKKNNSQPITIALWSAVNSISNMVSAFYNAVEADKYLSTAYPLYNIGGSTSIIAASGVLSYYASTPLMVDSTMYSQIKLTYTTGSGTYASIPFNGSQTWDLNGTHLSTNTSSFPVNSTNWKFNIPITRVKSSLIYSFYSQVFDYDLSWWTGSTYSNYYVTNPDGIDTTYFMHKYIIWGLTYWLRQPFSILALQCIFNIIYNNPFKIPGNYSYNNSYANIDPNTVGMFQPLSATQITITTDPVHPFYLTVHRTGNTLNASYDPVFVTNIIDNFLPKHLNIQVV